MLRSLVWVGFVAMGCQRAQPQAAATPLELGNSGLGSIGASTPWSVQAVRALFEGAEVITEPVSSEGEVIGEVIVVRRDGRKLVEVARAANGKQVDAVAVYTPDIVGPRDARVGMTFGAFIAAEAGACAPGMEEHSGKMVCTRSSAPQVSYVFSGSWDGPDGEMPPAPVLKGFRLERMTWSAHGEAACAIAGSPTKWATTYCAWKIGTDDYEMIPESDCYRDAEKQNAALKNDCERSTHWKRKVCEHVLQNGLKSYPTIDRCLADPAFGADWQIGD